MSEVGSVIGPMRVDGVAHGGHCVARHEGRVVFVRHSLPGELVRVRVTDDTHDRFWRADAVEVLEAAEGRVPSDCAIFTPGGCGGCDFRHADRETELELKRRVVAEQLSRLARITWQGRVEPVDPAEHWRTRMRYQTTAPETPFGLGLRAHRSERVVALPETGCRLAAQPPPQVEADPGEELVVVDAASGRVTAAGGELFEDTGVTGSLLDGRATLTEHADGRDFEVAVDGFWQVHPQAADTLVAAVLEGLDPRPGERGFDLYCGVGLFSSALSERGVTMWGVESDKDAIALARRNVPAARFSSGRVERVLTKLPRHTDLVVLDPPRAGAGRKVLTQVLERTPRALALVACDPAALGRDLAYAAELGWSPRSIRAFDLFPRTHHVECVAILAPDVVS